MTRAVGLVIRLLIANFLLASIFVLPIPRQLIFIKPMVGILGSVVFSFMGISLTDPHRRTLLRLINLNSIKTMLVSEGMFKPAFTKVLDPSCIIDGRIEQLLKIGFIEERLLVP